MSKRKLDWNSRVVYEKKRWGKQMELCNAQMIFSKEIPYVKTQQL
jgi:hypothetical protein